MKQEHAQLRGRNLGLGLALVVIFILLAVLSWRSTQPHSINQAQSIPTLYVQETKATTPLMKYANRHHQAHTVLSAVVSPQGKVALTGNWQTKVKHPLIKVTIQQAKTLSYRQMGRNFRQVLLQLQQQYRIKKYNVVAQSSGNTVALAYQVQAAKQTTLPQLQRQVNITTSPIPAHDLDYFWHQRRHLKNNVRVLNIQQQTTNLTPHSLKTLLKPRVQQYQEVTASKPAVIGSQISQFLW